MTPILLPLYLPPSSVDHELRYLRAAQAGPHSHDRPGPVVAGELLTVVVDAADDPADPDLAGAVSRLAKAGVATLGRVDLGFATRPVADLLDDVTRWTGSPVSGVFLDQAPTSAFSLGPVALAIRAAHRAGLATVVLNPGVPTDPLYRDLDVPICTFEGSWPDYQRWRGEGAQPGDGHLVHSVPRDSLATARALLRERRAGWGLVTDRTPPAPYAGLPIHLA